MGVLSEHYLGGKQIRLGYHRRPKLKLVRFADPFSADGKAVCKIADPACFLPGGKIESVRMDHEVKSAFRIELAEIESVLAEHLARRS